MDETKKDIVKYASKRFGMQRFKRSTKLGVKEMHKSAKLGDFDGN